MPRQLALLLCSVFVFYLLKYDRKQSIGVSWVLWVPTLWMFSITSRSINAWFGGGGGDAETGGGWDHIFQAGLFCIGSMVLLRRKLNWAEAIRNNLWLSVLIGWMLVSIVWSDMPLISFKSWVKEILAVVMALVVLTEPEPKQAMQKLFRRTIYILVPFSVLLIKYYPNLGVSYNRHFGEVQWLGVTQQKNSLGQLCLIAIFFLTWTLTKRWKGRDKSVGRLQTGGEVLVLLMAAWLLKGPSIGGASATALYVLSMALAALFSLLWMKKHRVELGANIWILVIACIIGLGVVTPLAGGGTITGFTSAVGRDATLTGRTEIWAGLLPELMRQPVLGYGFAGFWNIMRTAEHEIGQAHNGYLEIWLQLGLVGLLLTVAWLLSCARKARRILQYDFDWGCLCLCFVLMTATESITESAIDSLNRPLTAIVLLLSISAQGLTRRGEIHENTFAPTPIIASAHS
jgi:exopolysaccharide production protein ExoQ